jgi:acyl-coenzyme A synthetase/AMP-(fatty) acid ligase
MTTDTLPRDNMFPDGASGPFGPEPGADEVTVLGSRLSLSRVARVLQDHPDIDAAAVGLITDGGLERLRAHLVPAGGRRPSPMLVAELEAWARQHLRPEERPRLLVFGGELPSDARARRA